jgi:mannose-1-phosphate guanylyltransferase
MHAIVLVGGFGTRLRPLTNTLPKSMLTIGNEPIITRLVERLGRHGVTTVTLSLGFLPDPFIEAFPDDRCGAVALHYAVEPEPLDTAGAIRFAALEAGVDDTFVVVNGDVINDLDVAALVRRHREVGATATLHLTPVGDPSAFGVVELGGDGRVGRFLEKPAPGTTESNLINAGTYVMEPEVIDAIPHGRRVSVERETFPALAAERRLFGMATDDYWLDVGRPELLLQANLDRLAGRFDAGLVADPAAAYGVHPDATVHPSAAVGSSSVDRGATIGAGATIERSVVLAGAVIGEDVVVHESVVMGVVADGATLRGAVVGAEGVVAAGGQVTNERVPVVAP